MMKKYFVYTFLFLAVPWLSFAQWNDCSSDCSYPGDCGAYVDTNSDELCDHGQAEPNNSVSSKIDPLATALAADDHDLLTGQELKTMSVSEVAEAYDVSPEKYAAALSEKLGVEIGSSDEFQALHDNLGVRPSDAKSVIEGLTSTEKGIDSKNQLGTTEAQNQAIKKSASKKYLLVPVVVFLLAVYLFTWSLAANKKIRLLTHRRIWNFLLLISFLLCGISGIILILKINYGWVLSWPFNLLKIHVETGVVMTLITFFHISWHWKYFSSVIKKK